MLFVSNNVSKNIEKVRRFNLYSLTFYDTHVIYGMQWPAKSSKSLFLPQLYYGGNLICFFSRPFVSPFVPPFRLSFRLSKKSFGAIWMNLSTHIKQKVKLHNSIFWGSDFLYITRAMTPFLAKPFVNLCRAKLKK